MTETQITIINRLGLHARAAAKFVTEASHFDADVTLTKDGRTVNGKSIMGVMMLAASQGSQLTIMATGADEIAAVRHLTKLVESRFGESE